jgi:hypothetical protein
MDNVLFCIVLKGELECMARTYVKIFDTSIFKTPTLLVLCVNSSSLLKTLLSYTISNDFHPYSMRHIRQI